MAAAAPLPKGLALAKIMANYDTPMKWRSQPPLEEQDEAKRKLAMSEDPCWKTTGRATAHAPQRGPPSIQIGMSFV
jgi:hypothetical protein